VNEKYPSGGNYPETKEDYAEHLIRQLKVASPEQMQSFTQKHIKRGGKFEILAHLLMGLIDIDEAHEQMTALEDE
jgi:hypothetical protein